jgi:hypothetical protein
VHNVELVFSDEARKFCARVPVVPQLVEGASAGLDRRAFAIDDVLVRINWNRRSFHEFKELWRRHQRDIASRGCPLDVLKETSKPSSGSASPFTRSPDQNESDLRFISRGLQRIHVFEDLRGAVYERTAQCTTTFGRSGARQIDRRNPAGFVAPRFRPHGVLSRVEPMRGFFRVVCFACGARSPGLKPRATSRPGFTMGICNRKCRPRPHPLHRSMDVLFDSAAMFDARASRSDDLRSSRGGLEGTY